MNTDSAFQQAIKESNRARSHYENAPERFLKAWKKAVEIIGPAYFHCQSTEACTAATSREQLRPDNKTINHYLDVCSVGQGIFIGAVVSFFNGDWGAEICNRFGYTGIGDVANRLELNELEVVVELMLSHTGW